MKLKVPPAVVTVIFALLMYLFSKLFAFGSYSFIGKKYVALFFISFGILIGIFAVTQFFKQKTTIDPRNPDKVSTLVIIGLYVYSRNPMYVGLLLFLIGLGLWLGNIFNSILAVCFVLYMNRFQIQPEEEVLLLRFGEEYKEYCTRVRRWL